MIDNIICKYFYNDVNKASDADICSITSCKSGKLAEECFKQLYPYMRSQVSYNNYRFDFTSKHVIYEIKNYMYESTGTADEKLVYSLFKYIDALGNKYRNIVIVLCAKMEVLYNVKYRQLIHKQGLMRKLNNNGVFVVYMSDLINDFCSTPNTMSFLKWVGGKSKLLEHIIPHIEKHIESEAIDLYLEPFLGSGSVMMALLTKYPKLRVKANDVNKELIIVFRTIQLNIEELVFGLTVIDKRYKKLSMEQQEELYYELRDTYNMLITVHDKSEAFDLLYHYELIDTTKDNLPDNPDIFHLNLLISILFIFLNKTCFRGLYRVNKVGEMNVPFGHYKNPCFIDEREMRRMSKLISHVEFSSMDYKDFINLNANTSCVMYLDPPYYATFNDYSSSKFKHDEFAEMITNLDCKLVVSNSIDFIDKYSALNDKFTVDEYEINNKINSKSPDSKRTEVVLFN